jgi:hypothetical protein
MKRKSKSESENDLRPEYDFHYMQIVARGPGRKVVQEVTVRLVPDVAEAFPHLESVNELLRFLIRVTKGQPAQPR